ncbi:MAG: hypothetical protein IPK58_18460 [Acidobacteria bacterium]|nr:hypothetical protein [Acidobacteriota bacterium]
MNKAKANIEDGIEKAWSGKFEKDGVTYTVVTDVTVETFANVDDAMKSGVQNVIEMDQG